MCRSKVRAGGFLQIFSGAEKKHLIEAAQFGRLDQMLRTTVQGWVRGGLWPPSQKPGGLGGAAPPSQKRNVIKKPFLEKALSRKAFNSMPTMQHGATDQSF